MKRVKLTYGIKTLLIVAFSIITFCGCDPEFRYEFTGKIKSELKKPINLKYKFLPIENANNWRSMITDSLTQTDANGNYRINVSTLTVNFDSLIISINELGYEPVVMSTNRGEWKKSMGLNIKEFKYKFEDIDLIQIDSTKACQIGREKADLEISNQEYTLFEFFKTGTKNQNYHNQLIAELNKLGIKYKTIALTDVESKSKDDYERNCYLSKMKKGLELKYGENWLDKIVNKIKE